MRLRCLAFKYSGQGKSVTSFTSSPVEFWGGYSQQNNRKDSRFGGQIILEKRFALGNSHIILVHITNYNPAVIIWASKNLKPKLGWWPRKWKKKRCQYKTHVDTYHLSYTGENPTRSLWTMSNLSFKWAKGTCRRNSIQKKTGLEVFICIWSKRIRNSFGAHLASHSVGMTHLHEVTC